VIDWPPRLTSKTRVTRGARLLATHRAGECSLRVRRASGTHGALDDRGELHVVGHDLPRQVVEEPATPRELLHDVLDELLVAALRRRARDGLGVGGNARVTVVAGQDEAQARQGGAALRTR
jgi:hypothetical protein